MPVPLAVLKSTPTLLLVPPERTTVIKAFVPSSPTAKAALAKSNAPNPKFVPPTRRATRFRRMPFTLVKPPPIIMFPSVCVRIVETTPFAPVPTLNVRSIEPSLFSRVMRLRGSPPTLANPPPSTTLPFGCTDSVLTNSSAPTPGLKVVSTDPSVLNRPMRLRATPLRLVKRPPTTGLFPEATPTQEMLALAPTPGSKVLSTVPSKFNRAMFVRITPLTELKPPTIKMRPTASVAMPLTGPSAPEPGLNVASTEPSELSRAMKFRLTPLMVVKRPPSSTLPSFWMCNARTELSAPGLLTKLRSTVPSRFSRTMFPQVAAPMVLNEPPTTTLPALTSLR